MLCRAMEPLGFAAKSSRAGLVKQLRAGACALGYVGLLQLVLHSHGLVKVPAYMA